jgi:hypothetical protein
MTILGRRSRVPERLRDEGSAVPEKLRGRGLRNQKDWQTRGPRYQKVERWRGPRNQKGWQTTGLQYQKSREGSAIPETLSIQTDKFIWRWKLLIVSDNSSGKIKCKMSLVLAHAAGILFLIGSTDECRFRNIKTRHIYSNKNSTLENGPFIYLEYSENKLHRIDAISCLL